MKDKLIEVAEYKLKNSDKDLSKIQRYSLIKKILNTNDPFMNMSIEYAYSILRDLQIPESELKEVYKSLI